MQALEGVLGVAHVALVDVVEVMLHIGPGERRAAQQHRVFLGDAPGVHLLQVVLHDHGGLHQQPGHADGVDLVLLGGLQDGVDRLLDADVDHVVAVVGHDDVDQVLADVVHVALDRGQQQLALAAGVVLLHVRFQVGHRRLHHLGGLEHERQLHLPGAEQLTHDLHAGQQVLVDDPQRRFLAHRRVQVDFQAVALAVDDPPFQPLEQRQLGQLLGPRSTAGLRGLALEDLHELLQRVVALAAPVVDQVERDLPRLLLDLAHRQDLRSVQDRGVQSRFPAFVEEHRVQHLTRRRVESERHVRQAERGLNVRMALLEFPDRVDRLDGVLADLFLTGGDREDQAVDDDRGLVQPPVGGHVLDQPLGDPQLPLGGARLAFLVDAGHHDGGTVLDDQLHHAFVPRSRLVAVLVVHRVDRAPAAQVLQTRLDHVRLRGVHHDRQCRGGG